MSVNIVQLQRGISIPEFMKQYGTEDKCISALESQRWPNGFICLSCGNKNYCILKTKRLYQCNSAIDKHPLLLAQCFILQSFHLERGF